MSGDAVERLRSCLLAAVSEPLDSCQVCLATAAVHVLLQAIALLCSQWPCCTREAHLSGLLQTSPLPACTCTGRGMHSVRNAHAKCVLRLTNSPFKRLCAAAALWPLSATYHAVAAQRHVPQALAEPAVGSVLMADPCNLPARLIPPASS